MKNKIQDTVRKAITGVALAGSLILPYSGLAQKASGSVETLVGDKKTTIDLKVDQPLMGKAGLFIRNRDNVDYKGNSDAFTLTDLTYGLNKNFDALLEAQFAEGLKTKPRPGMQYHRSFGDINVFNLNTIEFDKRDINLENNITLSYTPSIGKNTNLLLKGEVLSNNNINGGHNFTTERLRLGVDKGRYSLGVGADLLQKGKNFDFGYNVGGFFSLKF